MIISFAIILLILAPFVAHAAGGWTARRLSFKPGYIRDWMPSIPNNTVTDPSAEKRWVKRGAAVEARMLKRLENGGTHITAEAMAGEMGEDVSVVAAVLARMREEIDCRLQVTRSGQLLHTFKAADIQALRKKKRMSWPARASIFVLSIFANIGAAWPMVLSILVAVGALFGMALVPEPLMVGVGGILGVIAIFGTNAVLGWFIHAFMTPWMNAPRLGSAREAETGDMLEDQQAREFLEVAAAGDATDWIPVASSSGDGCGAVDLGDIDSAEGLAVAVVAAILVAIIVGLTFAAGVWLRGLWRAAKRLGIPDLIMSPTSWIRGSHPVDKLERWIPTNDLVIRVTRSLRRVLQRSHPEDGGMVQRVLSIAKRNGGRVSALEIALFEALDLAEANTVGAELTTFLDGRIDVSDDGELDFVFPEQVLSSKFAKPVPDRNAEYLDFKDGRARRRKAQQERSVPINIPGFSYGHLIGTDRLVAGTLMMTAVAMMLVHLYPGVSPLLQIGVDFLFPIMTLGAFALSGVARYTSAAMAKHGVFRDIRRAAFVEIDRVTKLGGTTVDFQELAGELRQAFKGAYRGLKFQDVLKELEAVAIDLELETDMSAEGRAVYRVDSIGQRLKDLKAWRDEQVVFDFQAEVENPDEVVFDTEVAHDRVVALA